MSKNHNAQGISLMLAASVAFAAMAAATKALGGRLPASEVVFIRSSLSSLGLVAYFSRQKNSRWPGNKPAILAARGVIGFIALFLYFWALPRIHLGTAILLNYTAPIFAVIGSHFIFKEKSPPSARGLIAASFFGVYLLTAPQIAKKPAAFLAALASGFLAGMVHLLIRQSSDENEPPLLIIFYFTAICTAGSALFWPMGGWIAPDPRQWALLWIVTASSFVGQMGLTYSLKKAPVSVVSPFGYITPVIGLAIGFFIWKENPDFSGCLGSLIVVFCGALLYRRQT